MADGVAKATASRPIKLLLVRYDDLLAEAQPESCPVVVDAHRVEQLFRAHGGEE